MNDMTTLKPIDITIEHLSEDLQLYRIDGKAHRVLAFAALSKVYLDKLRDEPKLFPKKPGRYRIKIVLRDAVSFTSFIDATELIIEKIPEDDLDDSIYFIFEGIDKVGLKVDKINSIQIPTNVNDLHNTIYFSIKDIITIGLIEEEVTPEDDDDDDPDSLNFLDKAPKV